MSSIRAIGCGAATAAVLGLAVLAAHAQPPGKIPRVGVIAERSQADPFHAAFRQGIRELGYVEGKNIVLEYRYAHGVLDRVPELAAELIRLGVDLLVVGGTVSAQAAKAATVKVPIVFVTPGDPVESGLVSSLARPGGNATGLSILAPELAAKQLEMLKAAVPRLSRVTVIFNPDNPSVVRGALNAARPAARALSVELHVLEIRQRKELTSAVSALPARGAGALLIISDPIFGSELAQLSRLAIDRGLPAIYNRREFAEVGGLLSYGPSFADNYRRAAVYVDKILKGAKPADLPVEQPTKFELVINLKTARTLGLEVPPLLLGRADHVIQ